VAGRRLTFHLAGINNQNFLMRDEETGSYCQKISGSAISGPLKVAIEGSRRFRPLRALGLMRYEGCLIMVFIPGVSLDGAASMTAAANSAVRFEERNGTRVAASRRNRKTTPGALL
jgi:hypothetical protein